MVVSEKNGGRGTKCRSVKTSVQGKTGLGRSCAELQRPFEYPAGGPHAWPRSCDASEKQQSIKLGRDDDATIGRPGHKPNGEKHTNIHSNYVFKTSASLLSVRVRIGLTRSQQPTMEGLDHYTYVALSRPRTSKAL
eukprot:scaffold1469_cov257-Pinguiococcus_pyrenoidosus.AAC.5